MLANVASKPRNDGRSMDLDVAVQAAKASVRSAPATNSRALWYHRVATRTVPFRPSAVELLLRDRYHDAAVDVSPEEEGVQGTCSVPLLPMIQNPSFMRRLAISSESHRTRLASSPPASSSRQKMYRRS